jgi:hypothetical protein
MVQKTLGTELHVKMVQDKLGTNVIYKRYWIRSGQKAI